MRRFIFTYLMRHFRSTSPISLTFSLFCLSLYVVFLFKGTLANSKLRASCRYRVYELAEAHRGKLRAGQDDGIYYDPVVTDNLRVQLVFEEKPSAEDFESQLIRLSGRWRKRPFLSAAEPDVDIQSEGVTSVPFSGTLTRVMSSNYKKMQKVGDTEISPDLDQYSWTSTFTGVEIDDEVRLRLLEREDSTALFRQKVERCHLVSKKNKTYEFDPNNIVFCSRNLHQQFDAINSTAGVEQFCLKYVSHDPNPCMGLLNRKECPVYATTVHVIFIDQQAKNTLHSDFKPHTDVDVTTIQLELKFPDPRTFEYCATERAKLTRARWKSYEGIND